MRFTNISRISPHVLFLDSRSMWLSNLISPQPTYNISVFVTLEGTVDRPALQAALRALAARHEALRTVFPQHPETGEPYQRILPTGGLPHARLVALKVLSNKSSSK